MWCGAEPARRHSANGGTCQNHDVSQAETTSTRGILGGDPGAKFELTRITPSEAVAEYVERHWIVRWDLAADDCFTQELLPHPCVNLVTESSGAAVHGIPLRRSAHRLDGAGVAVGTKFRPGAFTAFAGVPPSKLVGASWRLPAVFGEDGAVLERQLTAASPETHIARVEDFLRSHMPIPNRRLERLRSVVADMLVADRAVGVGELARRHAMSPSTLQRLFRDLVGVTPKWVLKRYRVHEAVERIASGEAPDAAGLARDLGYFDQSHFIHDFTAQVGQSPGAYARACAAVRTRRGDVVSA